ncbi:MAG: radical SAM protein [Desulfobacteraceae bacterium]|nr:radical SAM protein [Desulfobacteraceae bacterium]
MTGSTLKLAGQLLFNGLRFQYLKWRGHPGKPQAVSLEITHNCIAKCIMCNIWKIPREVMNLSVDDWLHLLSSDLFSDLIELDITGGEPFLVKDLVSLFAGICELKQNNLKALKSIAVTTNGFLTGRVLNYTEKILPGLRDKHIDLVMVCAMDGIGDLHKKIRNYPDAWSKVNETIQGLKRLREKNSNLIIGLKTTILPINVDHLEEIVQYANSNELFTIISPCIITDARYLNPDRADDLVFKKEDMEKMIRFYQSGGAKWSYHSDTLLRYLKTGILRNPCSCGFNYFFVRSTGEVFLCPLINKGFGNIKDGSVKSYFSSEKAAQFRRRVGKFPECRRCTEPGLERYALPYEGFTYLSLLIKMRKNKFLELHRHMGLDKYFSSLLSKTGKR